MLMDVVAREDEKIDSIVVLVHLLVIVMQHLE